LREDYGGVWGSARGAAKTGETRFSENWGPILVSLVWGLRATVIRVVVDERREIGSFTARPRRDKKGESTAVKAWLID
jgi:hypothetical protein